MIIILLILLIVVAISSLPSYHNKIILEHLRKYHCNPKLYNLVLLAKNTTRGFTESVRIETSTKGERQGRYIIPILLSEFKRYPHEARENILGYLGFSVKQYEEFINDQLVGPNTDLIVGVDGKKGKLYLDYGYDNIKLKCLESTGKVKYYIKQEDPSKDLDVLRVEANGKVAGYHYRMETPKKTADGDYIYWVAKSKDGTKTYYTRPELRLIDLVDFIKYASNI